MPVDQGKYDEAWTKLNFFDRNKKYAAHDGPYQTHLSPEDEKLFRKWLSDNGHAPPIKYFNADDPNADYDMRGFWKDPGNAGMMGVNPSDNKIHFNDKYKTPYHETFSSESVYAGKSAPRWEEFKSGGQSGWQLVSPEGEILKIELDAIQ